MATIAVGDAAASQEDGGRKIQERFYAMICGLQVREKNTFMEFEARCGSGDEDGSGETTWQRQCSAPAAFVLDKIADTREGLASVNALGSLATSRTVDEDLVNSNAEERACTGVDGLAVREKNTSLELEAPRGSDVEDVPSKLLQEQQQRSAPASTSGIGVYTSESLASMGAGVYTIDSLASASMLQAPAPTSGAGVYTLESLASVSTLESLAPSCAADDGAANSGAEEEVKDREYPNRRGGGKLAMHNMCKNKRLRLRKWEGRAAAAIAEDPSVDIESFNIPLFVEVSEELTHKVRARLREVQRQVLAGIGGSPSGPAAALVESAAP